MEENDQSNIITSLGKKLYNKLTKSGKNDSAGDEEFITYVEEAKDIGSINENEEDMIKQVLEFDEMTVAEILTPRVEIIGISNDETDEEIEKIFYESGFSRLPVYEDTIDNIMGVLLLKDYFYSKNTTHKKVKDMIRPTAYITKTMKLAELLALLQRNQCHLAVVVDEFGGTVGIVTIEDIIEELIGEIWDEHDIVIKNIEKAGVNKYKVMGGTDIEDLFVEIGMECPEDITSTTVNGWILETLDRLPEKGEHLNFDRYDIIVGKVDKNRIEYVLVNKK